MFKTYADIEDQVDEEMFQFRNSSSDNWTNVEYDEFGELNLRNARKLYRFLTEGPSEWRRRDNVFEHVESRISDIKLEVGLALSSTGEKLGPLRGGSPTAKNLFPLEPELALSDAEDRIETKTRLSVVEKFVKNSMNYTKIPIDYNPMDDVFSLFWKPVKATKDRWNTMKRLDFF